ncbi:type 1 glutamine amidotransferase [Paenibacillaceae bacterium]|nr:type 1 glutamine amidotransferase [Paenibacillaceae bacterium]
MNILLLKHYDFDDIGAFSEWAALYHHRLIVRDPAAGLELELLASIDSLIILGGPMSVYQEERYPWLKEEKRFVLEAVQRKKRVLGICLGAQLLAEVLGGKVYRHLHKEIGWHRIERTGESHPFLADLPDVFYSFQWHEDVFDLPPGATWLAYSTACSNQAFSYGEHVVGLQFHLEATPECIELMLHHWRSALVTGEFIQPAEQIRSELGRSVESFRMLHRILDLLHERELSGEARSECAG